MTVPASPDGFYPGISELAINSIAGEYLFLKIPEGVCVGQHPRGALLGGYIHVLALSRKVAIMKGHQTSRNSNGAGVEV